MTSTSKHDVIVRKLYFSISTVKMRESSYPEKEYYSVRSMMSCAMTTRMNIPRG